MITTHIRVGLRLGPAMSRLATRVKTGWSAVRAALTPSAAAWSGARVALLILWAIVLVWVAAADVGQHFSVEKIAGFAAIFAVMTLGSLLVLLVLWLIGLLAP